MSKQRQKEITPGEYYRGDRPHSRVVIQQCDKKKALNFWENGPRRPITLN